MKLEEARRIMSPSKFRRMRGWLCLLLMIGLGSLAAFGGSRMLTRRDGESFKKLPVALVEKSDLHVRIVAGGEVDSAEKTLIECELESLSINSEGRSFTTRAASQIIELLPEGTQVKKGDVLCRLDASEFEEMVRQQEIKVLQARADQERARYELEAAEVALLEYREGLLVQQKQQFEAQRRLAQADIQRANDRMEWSRRMVDRGYISEGQLLSDDLAVKRATINLERAETQLRKLERYDAPATISRLEMQVDRCRNEKRFQEMRLKNRETQLAKFQKQVENCTIRAPHDGLLLYANEKDSDSRIEVGTTVYQKMDLFYLPNFDQMEVMTVLNESRVASVESGMPALVRVEALGYRELDGHVISVAPLPILPKNWRSQSDVRNYMARVKIHNVPRGLRPGMSAEVEIVTEHRPSAIVIPSTAVAYEGGVEYCYLPGEAGLERRPIESKPATRDLVQVVHGLNEGEVVVADASLIEPDMSVIASPRTSPAPGKPPTAERVARAGSDWPLSGLQASRLD